MAVETRPAVVVGSGPAGASTALYLQAVRPQLAGEIVVLEKARHPRPKVCAGGLIPHTLECLRELDVPLSVPYAVADRARVDVPGGSVAYAGEDLCRVVRRDEFDASLVDACRRRGVEVREHEKVVSLRREGSWVRVETERGEYRTRVVVGADGSGSVVRRELVPDGRDCVGKAVMCDVPVARANWSGFAEGRYDFGFAAVPAGLRGYRWAFPCVIAGEPHVNVGVYSVVAGGVGQQLRRVLDEYLRELNAPAVAVQSFPIRWYGAGVRVCAPGVLLAGDAAGVDALMGEGISYSLEYGRRAAAAVADAADGKTTAFADYERSVSDSWLGRKLRRLELGTRLFYGPTWRLWFAIAARSPAAQGIGIRWYNGVDGWDRRSGWEALGAWLRGGVPAATEQPSS